ncbi:MAG: single-stranded DNA-binding protein [Actinoallomurus sp.]
MNDATVTVIGFIAHDPHFQVLDSGMSLMSLRVGSTPRRYDRDIGQWRDEDPMYLTVNCWRTLADNLQGCELKRGDPVVVTGKLRIREYTKDGQRRLNAQVEATTVGHDLSQGVARFRRSQRSGTGLPEDRRQADDVADRWLGEDTSDDLPDTLPTQSEDHPSEPGEQGAPGEKEETDEPTPFRTAA